MGGCVEVKKIFSQFLIICLGLLISSYCCPCNAQEKKAKPASSEAAEPTEESFIATIDIAAVYALHPQMQYYDQKVDLFIKPPKPGTTYNDFLSLTQNRRNDFKKSFEGNATETKRIKGEIDTLKQEIHKLNVGKAIEAAPINQKFEEQISKLTSEAEIKKMLSLRTDEIQKIEKKFNIEIEKKNQKLADFLDSYEKIQRSLLKVFYLTPEETSKKFDEITNEIKETVNIAAKKHGVKAIINVNSMPAATENKKTAEINITQKTKTNAELEELLLEGPDYSKVLGILKTFEHANAKSPFSDRTDSEYRKFLQQMYKDQEKENFSKGYLTRDYIMQLKQLRDIKGNPIIYGSTDITWFTVIAVMVKNGIPKEKAETISEIILNKSANK